MNHVEDKLPALVREELREANLEHPHFHSLHEGYAVLKEEVEESREAMQLMERSLDLVWGHTRYDSVKAFEHASQLEQHAIHLAAEAIQAAAMAHKFLLMQRKDAGHEG